MGWMFRLSLLNMRRRMARTVLTILGVTIGVISVVSLLALGLGVKKELLSEFEDENTVKNITVYSSSNYRDRSRLITDRTLKKFEEIDKVSYVYPQYEVYAELSIGKYSAYTDIIGIPGEQLAELELTEKSTIGKGGQKPELILGNSMGMLFYNYNTGLSFSECEDEKLTSVIDTMLPAEFGFGDNSFTTKLKVTGVLSGGEEDYSMQSQSVFCDLDILKKYLKYNANGKNALGQPVDENGNTYGEWVYTSAVVVADDIDDVDFIVKKLQDMGFQIHNEKAYLENVKREIKVIQILLGGIGVIALVVAVIGISNTMTTAVYDRVNEIGMLKVIGCDMDEMMLMFIFESAVLGFSGGVLGVALSFGIKGIINKAATAILGLAQGTVLAVIPPSLVFISIFLATLLGILAGYFPAKWASKLNPLTAVRQ